MNNSEHNITRLLNDVNSGDQAAINQLLPVVYCELKIIASKYLSAEHGSRTIQTTDLVHEAYLKLIGSQKISWQNRAHFFGIAANSMRQILVDLARKRKAAKRGGDETKISLSEGIVVMDETDDKLIALDEALNKLAEFDQRLSKIVELRFFSGLTIEETSAVLNLSDSTIKREWNVAKAWLHRELNVN